MTPGLKAALERALGATPDSWGDDKLHVSDLAVSIPGDDGKCPRQLWLRLHGAEKAKKHPGQHLMFAAGHRLHAAVVEWLREGLEDGWEITGVECDLTSVLPEGLSGTCDIVLTGPNGERVVVDTKSLRGRAFSFLDSPKPANVLQVQAYCFALDADYGMLLYVDREGQNFAREFRVERDDAAVKEAVDVAKRIEGLLEPPPVLQPKELKKGKKNPWQCDYCDYCGVSCPGAVPKEAL